MRLASVAITVATAAAATATAASVSVFSDQRLCCQESRGRFVDVE